MLNLSALLEDSARRHPDRDAVVLGDVRVDYQTLNALANQVANLLVSRGIKPGDKVALSCPNLPQFPAVYYAILKAGAVVVPLNVLLKGREVAYHLEDSDAKAYICFEGSPELPMGCGGLGRLQRRPAAARPSSSSPPRPEADSPIEGAETLHAAVAGQPTTFETVVTEATDTAVILYTSGTTGQPKGAELSHANLLLNALTCNRQFGVAEHDVHLITLPLFHSFGSTVQMNAGLRGRRDAGAASPVRRREGRGAAAEGERHVLRGRAHDVLGAARRAHRRRRRRPHRGEPAGRGLRWRLPPRGDHQAVQGPLPRADPRGLRPLGDLAAGDLRGPGTRTPAGLDRRADLGCRVPAGRQGLERRRGHGQRSARSRSVATTS